MTRTITKEFTVELRTGKRITSYVQALVTHDSGYGADADGNRAEARVFIDDLFIPDLIETDDEDRYLTLDEKDEAEALLLERAELDDWDIDFDEEHYDC